MPLTLFMICPIQKLTQQQKFDTHCQGKVLHLVLIRSPVSIVSSDLLSGKTNPGAMIIEIH